MFEKLKEVIRRVKDDSLTKKTYRSHRSKIFRLITICVAGLVAVTFFLQSKSNFEAPSTLGPEAILRRKRQNEESKYFFNTANTESDAQRNFSEGRQTIEFKNFTFEKWRTAVISILTDEDRRNNNAYTKKKDEKGEEPMESDLKEGWVHAAQDRRRKYPPYPEGLDLSKKYMFYNLTNDYAAGILHYGRSLSGMLKECHRLGRVAVWLPILVPSHHNRGKNELKDPALIFDKLKIKKVFRIELINEAEFIGRYRRSVINGELITWGSVGIAQDTGTAALLKRTEIILQRDYTGVWDRFLFSLGDDPELKDMTSELTYAPHLVALRDAVLRELGEDFNCVHVRRGDKMRRKWQWPHLENDTNPESLLQKLPQYLKPGSQLYIATDEFKEGFFDPVKILYPIKMAQDFKHFWAPGSDWYKSSVEIAGEIPEPTFDNFQQGFVDYGVCEKAKVRIETFPHLATDPWNGI